MKHYLVKIGIIWNGEHGKELKFIALGNNKADALFNTFKEFNLLEVIKLDHKEATSYKLVNYKVNEIE